MKGQIPVMPWKYVILGIAIMLLIAWYQGWIPQPPGQMYAPHQAGVSCHNSGYSTVCSWDFTGTASCPNSPYGDNIQFMRCPDFPNGISSTLCAAYGGSFYNGCCYGPYLTAAFTTIDGGDYQAFYIDNAYSVIDESTSCNPDPFSKPGIYPHYTGNVKITSTAYTDPGQPEPPAQQTIFTALLSWLMGVVNYILGLFG